ncbi:hypothetical protein RB195_018736 [Necator americanus]|uniref:Uncharacterized protein n=1 Tax=Necator americanus TaxID=51031 RepID=A0ABR1CB24_NECAM
MVIRSSLLTPEESVVPGITGLQEPSGHQKQKRTRMAICTRNAPTFAWEAANEEPMMQARKIKYDVIGFIIRRCHPLSVVYETGEELFLVTCDSRGVSGDKTRRGSTPALNIFMAYALRSNYEEEVEGSGREERLRTLTSGPTAENEQGKRLSEFIMATKTIRGNSQLQKTFSLRWT